MTVRNPDIPEWLVVRVSIDRTLRIVLQNILTFSLLERAQRSSMSVMNPGGKDKTASSFLFSETPERRSALIRIPTFELLSFKTKHKLSKYRVAKHATIHNQFQFNDRPSSTGTIGTLSAQRGTLRKKLAQK